MTVQCAYRAGCTRDPACTDHCHAMDPAPRYSCFVAGCPGDHPSKYAVCAKPDIPLASNQYLDPETMRVALIEISTRAFMSHTGINHDGITSVLQKHGLDGQLVNGRSRVETTAPTTDESLLGNDILTCLDKHADEHPLLRQAAKAIRELRPMAESWESYEAAQERKAERRIAEADADTARLDWLAECRSHVEWSDYIVRVSSGVVGAPRATTHHRAPEVGTAEVETRPRALRRSIDALMPPQVKTSAPICPTCETELAFEGDTCGLCVQESRT